MVQSIINFIVPLFDNYGYVILFFSSLSEGLPLLGAIIPGGFIAIFGGYIAKKEIISLSNTVLILMLGAFVGDLFNYYMGRKYGYRILKKYGKYIFLNEEKLEYVRKSIHNHKGKTIILGRFNSFTRSLAPFAAGASHVELAPFILYIGVSSFGWAASHALIGFIFGEWMEEISRYLGLIVFFGILAGFGCVYLYRYINVRHHVFKKRHIYTLSGLVFSLLLFTSTLQGVINNQWMYILDKTVASFSFSIQNPTLTSIMIFITNLGSAYYMTFFTAALVLYLFYKRRKYLGTLTLFSLLLGSFLQYFLKELIDIQRPLFALVKTVLPAFPSGHATSAMIFGLLLFLCLVDNFKSKIGKHLLFLGCLLGVILIAFSRIYLNAHWTSDVVAGIALGLFCVTFSILFFRVGLFIKRRWD
jgi:membrane protein DedA with SNARE-associated domain/membrane-associated phospholipid phosphatase